MLTLHCLFPNELLLALDILDRGLVKRFVRNDNTTTITTTSPTQTEDTDMFYVLSTSTLPHSTDHYLLSKSRTRLNPQSLTHMDMNSPSKGYEVRLHAWNCTCPTFTLSAFRDLGPEVPPANSAADAADVEGARNLIFPDLDEPSSDAVPTHFSFGGTLTRGSTKSSPPVCKHLLACLLAVRCFGLVGLGEEGVVEVRVEEGELAGWGAGWGG
ncbi:hypothetical protein BO94DRAFT_537596 [Aspergillus sclerotioniger CBS 115572]|uniref:SWIM-type domain-containing protein n=1 Tax=Aspergillus sclerotioniger CBS 115572 TaxID=1450535 RepID=A0A317VZP2_9EURO|nr:hypothetical protein BO94DRAFT_537596 [Aspergillus sclerotioniger CBS 115572]PWY78408.1 hypothetical protein BO94DRAFT_537596 [Aspergillus sclerotioniger CBS 115572]